MMISTVLLFLHYFIVQSSAEDTRARHMSLTMDMKFQCTNPNCSSTLISSVNSLIDCQFACLADVTCRITNFDQSTRVCQLFSNTSSGSLTMQAGAITMSVVVNGSILNVLGSTQTSTAATNGPVFTSTAAMRTSQQLTSTACPQVSPAGRAPTLGWLFENNLNDKFGVYNGISRNGPLSYGLGRHGCGACLNLTYSLQQSVMVNQTSFIDLRTTSFSIESWIKPSQVADGIEHVLFGQCPGLGVRYCIRASILGTGTIGTAFYGDSQPGSQVLANNTWVHVGYVYNYTAQTVSLYVNGTLDVSGGPRGPIQAPPYPLEIGNVAMYESSKNISFDGCIDELWFYPFARTAAEISATFALG